MLHHRLVQMLSKRVISRDDSRFQRTTPSLLDPPVEASKATRLFQAHGEFNIKSQLLDQGLLLT